MTRPAPAKPVVLPAAAPAQVVPAAVPATIGMPAPRSPRRQRGIALLVVLMTASLAAMLLTMQLSAARAATTSATINAMRAEARWAAESAGADALWLALSQRRANPTDPGYQGQAESEDPEEVIWVPDGRLYRLHQEGVQVEIRIFDANRGYDLQGNNPGTRLRSQFVQLAGPDGKLDPNLEIFFDRLNDYVDGDDFPRLNGREKAGYAELGLADWPRNAPLRYREELFWLEGVDTFLNLGTPDQHGLIRPPPPDALRLIPPGNGRFAGRPSFLSSSADMIMRLANLTPEELALALEAREAWYREQQPLTQGLGELYSKLSARFSMTPGSVYTVEVRATIEPAGVSRRQVLTVDTNRLFIGEHPAYLNYWEKLSY